MSMCCVTMYIYINNIIYQTEWECMWWCMFHPSGMERRHQSDPPYRGTGLRATSLGRPGVARYRDSPQGGPIKNQASMECECWGNKASTSTLFGWPFADVKTQVGFVSHSIPWFENRWASPNFWPRFDGKLGYHLVGNLTMENQHLKYSNLHMGHFQSTGGFSAPFWPRPQLQTFIFRR